MPRAAAILCAGDGLLVGLFEQPSEKVACAVKKKKKKSAMPAPIEHKIHLVRGHKVMLSADLAVLYQVETFNLNKAVKRNRERFPEDFMFQITKEEAENLKFQIGMSSWGGPRTLPYAFTEQGVAMLSSVLHSPRAIQMNIAIMRAFVRLREVIAAHKDLAARIEKLESGHTQHASIINLLAQEIRALKILPDPPPRHPIGFRIRKKDE